MVLPQIIALWRTTDDNDQSMFTTQATHNQISPQQPGTSPNAPMEKEIMELQRELKQVQLVSKPQLLFISSKT